VELIYALQNKIPYGSLQNAAGAFVKASLESVTAAAASASKMAADFRISMTNSPGKDAVCAAAGERGSQRKRSHKAGQVNGSRISFHHCGIKGNKGEKA
jgi:hypothetical protein